ncbi:hypothetical protein TNCV_2039581 [Trichonephila clavipes]|nr:hypothetical protein TNCV_2039581 [Trichonephila clavipes]
MLPRPLQQPYDGPFKVLQRKDKVFFLDINGKRVSVSIDRCKPAFFLNTEDLQLPQTKNETPATVEPNATAPTPATVVEHDPTASTPTQPSTRSGRKVHLPTRFPNLTIFMLFLGLSIRTIIKIQQGNGFSIPYCDEADHSPNYCGHLALAAKVAEIPVFSLIPGKEFRNLVLGVTKRRINNVFCLLPIRQLPVTTARLETHNVYPDLSARGARSGMRRN